MIEINNVTKTFKNFTALKNLNCKISDSCIYGLVGSNGAGKSTLMRLITGIYKPTSGSVSIDEQTVWDNPSAKSNFVFVPDELYFIPRTNINRMAKLYKAVYDNFDDERLKKLLEAFNLDPKKNIGTFSKGMKRLTATALALSCKTKYTFFDETFDGIDPVMRHIVKNIMFEDICDRQSTIVITSHSLRELEDTCDQLTLLHNGGIIFEKDIQNLKTSLFKIQVAYDFEYDKSFFDKIEMLEFDKKGKVSTFIIRGNREKTEELLNEKKPILMEVLPLSLEEVFIYELGALGYSVNDVIDNGGVQNEK